MRLPRRAAASRRASRLMVLASTGVLVAAISACGTSRDVGGDGDARDDCTPSEQAKAQIDKVWQDSARSLGLPELTPPDQEVCEVDTSQYAKDGPYTIGFASQGPTNSWALEYDYVMRNAAEREDVELLYASAGGDASAQVNNIQDLVAQKPDALIVTPMGSAIKGQVEQAARQDIPVVLCTGKLPDDTEGVVSTVGRSYELQGTLWAEWIAKQLDGEGRIAMLSGIAGVPTAEYQYQAAKKVFDRYPNIEIATRQYTDWSPTEAKKVAANLTVRYPDLDGIWSDSAFSGVGVIQAYEEAGKPIPPVTGDSSNAFLKEAKGTDVDFALSAYQPEQSQHCLDTAVEVLRGEPVHSVIELDAPAFTHEQLDDYYREECSDNLWVPSELTDKQLAELELC